MDQIVQPPTETEFALFQAMIRDNLGIHLPPHKITLLNNRLSKRLIARQCATYSEYFRLLSRPNERTEKQLALDLITTNETYFFREQKHFDFLRNDIIARHPRYQPMNVWSAACSSGQEPYSLAMVLDDCGLSNWHVMASDISYRVLEKAMKGIYPEAELEKIPADYISRYCKKGTGQYAGFMRIAPQLRSRISFQKVNLNAPFDSERTYDLIVLRNVMIYFESHTQAMLVKRLKKKLRPGGYLFVGHSESLHGLESGFEMIRPAIYRKTLNHDSG